MERKRSNAIGRAFDKPGQISVEKTNRSHLLLGKENEERLQLASSFEPRGVDPGLHLKKLTKKQIC